jgi:hypothetical protein
MSSGTNDGQNRTDLILLGAGVLALLGILAYFLSGSQQQLRKSPVGFDGLHAWVASEGHPVRSFTGGWSSDPDVVGLRVLPIFDTQLDARRKTPSSKEEYLMQSDEYDLTSEVLQGKGEIVRTLYVLPKWRSGMRLTGKAHPKVLLEKGAATRVLHEAVSSNLGNVTTLGEAFSDYPVELDNGEIKTAKLYVAQEFEGRGCTPVIGRTGAMILGRCPMEDGYDDGFVWVLSDPDLLNNHGLRLADNAAIAKEMILPLAGEGTFMIDYSDKIWLINYFEGVKRDRTWADLLQFFAYPFSVLWLSGAILFALILWRSSVRFGPILRRKSGADASKRVANQAAARLMRLTEQDGALLGDYANVRLSAIAARMLGPQHKNDPDAAVKFVRRKRPDLANDLQDAINAIRTQPSNLSPAAAIASVDKFEHILEQLNNDT